MSTMNLTNLGLFSKEQAVLLNDLVAVNKQLMPHVVATATGCSLEEAMALLIFLYDKNVVDGFVLVYHSKHQDFYFAKRTIKEGLPILNETYCQVCEENIDDELELLYDFEFIIKEGVSFEV